MNLVLQTDSYKFSHWKQYPPGTQYVYSYLESRGGMFDQTLFFGLQYYLLHYLNGAVVKEQDVIEAREFVDQHIGPGVFNFNGWMHIVKHYGGRLPVIIKAVPEGTQVDTHNVLMTIENTDPQCFWLTNYLETLLLKVWYPITVGTLSNAIRKVFLAALKRSGDPGLIDFKLHDFGYRGVSSEETAGIGAAAHLINFKGTDTVAGIRLLQKYYKGTLVVRPDSGNPKDVVLKVLDILAKKLGYETNSKGFRVLNPKVRVIQGDGVNYWTIQDTLTAMNRAGWSADNITFGMGGALLQQLNRDTQKFAFKTSSIVVNGEARDVFKDPVEGHDKASKRGRLALLHNEGKWATVPAVKGDDPEDVLRPVFRDGEILLTQSVAEIRQVAHGRNATT
ncbi:MAG: nicotinate phosphoribosyltransferase [Candidatus Angelobacter sp. Gp1-AA117]|nr:MAG: nicotinate phosphoribosyltransferase [Candidatus Angelobacter sp. Gp1-AA117]